MSPTEFFDEKNCAKILRNFKRFLRNSSIIDPRILRVESPLDRTIQTTYYILSHSSPKIKSQKNKKYELYMYVQIGIYIREHIMQCNLRIRHSSFYVDITYRWLRAHMHQVNFEIFRSTYIKKISWMCFYSKPLFGDFEWLYPYLANCKMRT